jgi:hypothetical protein
MTTKSSSSSMMERLVCFLERRCKMREYGGRVRVLDSHTCEVYDVPTWTHELHQEICDHFFVSEISVRSTPESLSRFSVRLRLADAELRDTLVTLGVIAALVAFVAFGLGYI